MNKNEAMWSVNVSHNRALVTRSTNLKSQLLQLEFNGYVQPNVISFNQNTFFILGWYELDCELPGAQLPFVGSVVSSAFEISAAGGIYPVLNERNKKIRSVSVKITNNDKKKYRVWQKTFYIPG